MSKGGEGGDMREGADMREGSYERGGRYNMRESADI